jgi:predicted RNA-binding Zn-ribbon protein involved in translation (DUF1610 family)
MQETQVQLLCPACNRDWELDPRELSGPRGDFACPDCAETGVTADFLRTKRDLDVVRQFSG